ncbi:MAG: PilT/PilU family type 4a pilus ATPase, partial [Gemmatimonadetes bacterium]|nr:PilT/PilU family type 4a pilus ATPase [Gemmatimonadota bacterium]
MADPTRGAAPAAGGSAGAPAAPAAPPVPPYNYKSVLQQMVQQNASDLHLKVGRPPTIRVDGELKELEAPPMRPEDLRSIGEQIMPPKQRREYDADKEADFAIGVPGIGRFRVNMYQQRGSIAYAFRAIAFQALSIKDLNLPPVLEQVAMRPRGLVLVTGITGSGKSTALASMVQYVNENRHANVITIEDPIEFLHRDINCHINQREVGTDTGSFSQALRRVLRQDPDIVMIGEIRDLETLEIALKAADTGHLVFSTLHTTDATQTINRVLSFYPPHQQA